jgi:23S rRNA pseudouridine1911/1915/1917 synthase
MSVGRPPERLDRCLVRLGLAASRRAASALIETGRVRVNGRHIRKGAIVGAGDQVELTAPLEPVTIHPNPDLAVPVLFADASILIVNKPALIPCHPIRPGERGTVMNAIAAIHPETAAIGIQSREGGLIHRLDNGTSGALIVARTADTFTTLRAAIRSGAIGREYRALVAGEVASVIEIVSPIAHHARNPRKMVTGEDAGKSARQAATVATPLSHYDGLTLLKILPRTGRRHQIRVHLASIGHPLAGDGLYGGPPLKELAAGRVWLHLARLDLDSPTSGRIQVVAPLPEDLRATLRGTPEASPSAPGKM